MEENNTNEEAQVELPQPLSKSEEAIERVTEELGINVPKSHEPLGMRLVALILVIGGLSLIATSFTDVLSKSASFGYQATRALSGILVVAAAYGLIKKQRWALWLLGVFIIIGFIVNPSLAILPAIVFVYLLFHRQDLEKGPIDYLLERLINKNPLR